MNYLPGLRRLAGVGVVLLIPVGIGWATWLAAIDASHFATASSPTLSASSYRSPVASAVITGKSLSGTAASISADYGNLPLSFEANQGQIDAQVRFLSRGQGYSLFLTASEAVLALNKPAESATARSESEPAQDQKSDIIRLQLSGGNPHAKVTGLDKLPGQSHYFIGNDPKQWHTDVAHYAKVKYQEVYPGIDLVYYGNQRQLEYDFIVNPGSDPRDIILSFQGADTLEIDADGHLILHTAQGELTQHRPVVYQKLQGQRKAIEGRYILIPANLSSKANEDKARKVSFQIASYDTNQPLIIDPILSYASYLGGSGNDYGQSIALDTLGNAYITGYTGSSNFPTSPEALDATCGSDGACNPDGSGRPTLNAFITKLNATGSALMYSTYLGGTRGELGIGIVVDTAGQAYITGLTHSPDFPTTPGAFDRVCGTDGNCNPFRGFGSSDVFITKLNTMGNALIYSTYLGGRGSEDSFGGIAIDTEGNAYVAGNTASGDFPILNAFQATLAGVQDIFLTKLNPLGTALIYSTYLGGASSGGERSRALTVDSVGQAYVLGTTSSPDFPTTPGAFDTDFDEFSDAFISKFSAHGARLIYSTYLGGGDKNVSFGNDSGGDITVDSEGNAYVTGSTDAIDFPTTPGALDRSCGTDGLCNPFDDQGFAIPTPDAFISKLNPTGTTLLYSTYLGGSGSDGGGSIRVDDIGNAYIAGFTSSSDFPLRMPVQASLNGSFADIFISKLNTTGSTLLYSTYLGGTQRDSLTGLALDAAGSAYVVGTTNSADFPVTTGAFQTAFAGGNDRFDSLFHGDAFIAKISEPTVAATCAGRPITVFGTSGDDTILGSQGADVIDGGTGNDTIFGLDGDDVICGGMGNDTLHGGPGNDRLFGQNGNDRLFGGDGADRLAGHGGDDELFGGDDNDVVAGGPGNDRLFGSNGNDLLGGNEGNDQLFGNAGDDRLFGQVGDDRLFGGDGNDALHGGLNTDRCDGQSGTGDSANTCESVAGVP